MKNKKRFKEIMDYVFLILAVILIRTFIATPIKVEQNSMYPTLKPNDIMILNKIGYTLNGVGRFEIIVIKFEGEYLIKRVIGLPNEVVEYKDSKLYVNSSLVDEKFVKVETEDFSLEDIGISKIPKDKYLVLGDNRSKSIDSRTIGLIDKNMIQGKTNLIIFPFKNIGRVN